VVIIAYVGPGGLASRPFREGCLISNVRRFAFTTLLGGATVAGPELRPKGLFRPRHNSLGQRALPPVKKAAHGAVAL